MAEHDEELPQVVKDFRNNPEALAALAEYRENPDDVVDE